ncbi:MFS transporter [Streptomyces achromogenes]|uniref:MFS transporter n=1 Tax=Streptomyces achromogenes TaxID=67255 RepID=UPI0036B0242E
MGTKGKPGRGRAGDAYRRVIGLTGPLLPCVSFLGRLPTATIQFGSVLLVARTHGSLTTAGLTGGALALGEVVCGPLVGRLADRHGQRTVVLAFSLVNAVAVTVLVAGALAGLPTPALVLLGAVAGATVPLVGPLARARLVALARRSGASEATVGAALSFESTLDELSFVLGPALVGLAAVLAHPAYAMAAAAALVATCGTAFALHPTSHATNPAGEDPGRPADPPVRGRAVAPGDPPAHARVEVVPPGSPSPVPAVPGPLRTRLPRPPMPPGVPGLFAALALQGAVFGACQAGITALTGRLGQADQAGLVYAAMGVMSAVAGLAMAAVPERVGARTRWRLATGAALALSLPLLGTTGLPALYAVVTVLGVACAPHLITVFGLLERSVAPSRLAETMGVATSALVGGQALAVAVTGRLAETHGPTAAFAVASAAAGLTFVLALTVRPATYAGGPGNALHARVPDGPDDPHRGAVL